MNIVHPTRRLFGAALVSTLAGRPSHAQAAWLTPEQFGAGGPGDQRAFEKLFAAMAESGRPARLRPGAAYSIDDDFVIASPGFHLEGGGATVIQRQPGRGFLQLRGEGATVTDLTVRFVGRRVRPAGAYRGYLGFQRVCAVWIEGGRATLKGVRGENLFNVICLRGPVRRKDGRSAIADGTAYAELDYTPRVIGNRVVDVAGQGCDFVLTGNQQEDLIIDGLTALDTTSLSVPPHAIYMQNPGSTGRFEGYSRNVIARRLNSTNNPYGVAFKFSDIRGLRVDGAVATRTAGGIMVSTSEDVIVNASVADKMIGVPGTGFFGVEISQSLRVKVVGGRADLASTGQGGGVHVYHGSSDVEISDFTVEDNLPRRSAMAPYRVDQNSQASFVRCRRVQRGAAKEMFVVSGGSRAMMRDSQNHGAGKTAQCARLVDCDLR